MATSDRTTSLKEGMTAPDFSARTGDGEEIRLSQFRGRKVVLYFYPKDNTPGCTAEACAFRDLKDEMRALGAVVLGVSKDSAKSHQRFSAKHGLNFPLLADTDQEVIRAYDVLKEKTMCGRTSLGVVRSTFIIDGEGVIRKVFGEVKVAGHDRQVLEALKAL